MLELKNITTHYGSIRILRDVNLKVKKGEITCLLGSNGAGKSTTIKTIIGLVKPSSGEIYFENERIDSINTPEIVKKGIATVPEGRRLFPKLTVEDNLLIGACTLKDQKKIQANLEKSYSIFPRLKERRSQTAGTLSGGEQQMVAMCRALMSEPKLILMDEPSLGLAPILIKEIFETIVKVKNELGTSIFLIEQNAHKAIEIADHVYVIQKGEIILESSGDEKINKEEIEKAYLHKNTEKYGTR
ncbi:branched-chain amino acid transport system ATP-binding protein [Desulfonispora thiosulfatigenes DSM 11270]|uniref:Branched-chain amino acid transport system ATP-binding protein n=1 Tax=Desulfonispora thiosulfatigenes DSM 11270 TaxID=656914 RepID=A0A1W1VF57_DESTI|nr:ABC transporter ATP-binding protein [Desulfonispora thiosulfatigenes]SMB91691.1 branched-chain amino acid transport system ATP-binding protein [Desulfonispora thiosulfatigenes DSM 11270]